MSAVRRLGRAAIVSAALWSSGCSAFAGHPPEANSKEPSPPVAADPAPVTSPPPAITPEQEVGVELDATRRAGLAAQARKDLEEAQLAIQAIPRETAAADRLQKIETVESLIHAARAAYDTDVQASAALAHKARLLASELGPG